MADTSNPCPFCDADERILKDNELAIVILSDPHKVPGHFLVMPKRHIEKPWEMTAEELQAVFDLIYFIEQKVIGKLGDGCDIRQNYRPFNELGVKHVVFHVLPRSKDDYLYKVSEQYEKDLYVELDDMERDAVADMFEGLTSVADKVSAGILVYRIRNNVLQVLLAHPGGPHNAKKDDGHWGLFKGLVDEGESLLETAKREFNEETSQIVPEDAELLSLGDFKRRDGKTIHIWALEADYDPLTIVSNLFEMEWPPRSGRMQSFPENDRAEWFDAAQCERKLFAGQSIFVDRLIERLQPKHPSLIIGDSSPDRPSLF